MYKKEDVPHQLMESVCQEKMMEFMACFLGCFSEHNILWVLKDHSKCFKAAPDMGNFALKMAASDWVKCDKYIC